VTKQGIFHWITDTVSLSYEARGMASPLRVRGHSTRSVVSSKALARGASLQDVCAVLHTHTVFRFYSLDMESSPGSQVLQGWSVALCVRCCPMWSHPLFRQSHMRFLCFLEICVFLSDTIFLMLIQWMRILAFHSSIIYAISQNRRTET